MKQRLDRLLVERGLAESREKAQALIMAGEVLVKIEAAALNGLDVFVRNGIPGVPVTFPHVPGADGTGVVEALGAGVKGPAPGTRVVLQPGLSCGTCEFCLAGERSLCVTFRILGEHLPGTFAEKIAVPRANVYPAPRRLSPEKAAASKKRREKRRRSS